MAFGVTPEGFIGKSLTEIEDELKADFRSVFGPAINVEPQSNFGQIIGIFAERLADVWALAEAIYAAGHPDGAEGVNLDNICAITGTVRKAATRTKVVATVTGTGGTTLPTGRIVKTTAGVRFQSVTTVVIPGVGAGQTLAGVEFEAVDTGPLTAVAGSLTQIETPVAGWTEVTNPLDHYLLGANIESDTELRARRENELLASASATNETIRQKILLVDDVIEAKVFENETDATDVNGLPPHSIECLVQGGADADIGAAILASKSAGIATYGGVTTTPVDTSGTARSIKFSRPTVINVYLVVNVTKDAALWPVNGADQVKAALVAYGDANFHVGDDVIQSRLVAAVFEVSGVVDVTLTLGTSPAPVGTSNIAIAVRELADLDTSRITVNVS